MLKLKKFRLRGEVKKSGLLTAYSLVGINILYIIAMQEIGEPIHWLVKLNILLIITGILALEFKPHLSYRGTE